MEIEQAMKILHPNTTLQALAEVEYFVGFNQGAKREAWDEACDNACVTVCDEIEKLQAENASLRDLLKLAVENAEEKREKGCEFCSETRPYPNVCSPAENQRFQNSKFCKYCGRKLEAKQ